MAGTTPVDDQWFEQFATIAGRLQQALRSAVAEAFEAPPRAVDLQRAFQLNATFASRLHRALSAESSRDVAKLLPGQATMTSLLGRMHEYCQSEKTIKELQESYYAYLREVSRVATSQQQLGAMLDRHDPSAQSADAQKQREAVFRASAKLVGARIDLVSMVRIVLPNKKNPQFGDVAQAKAYWGFQRTGDLDALILASGASENAREAKRELSVRLDGRAFDDDTEGAIVRELSSHELPSMKTVATTDVVYSACRGEKLPHNTSFDVVSAVRHNCWYRNVRLHEQGADQLIRRPNLPACLQVSDLLVHRDMWPGIEPELRVYRDTDLPVSINSVEGQALLTEIEHFDQLESLSPADLLRPISGAAKHAQLVQYLFDNVDVNLDDFRAYRHMMHYPAIGQSIWIIFRREEGSD